MQRFYLENETLKLKTKYKGFSSIKTVEDLFNAFLGVWSKETCSPKFREFWSETNPTAGECSITSLLIKQIFGGEIYKAKTSVANHAFNVIDGIIFDITCEQFFGEKFEYTLDCPFDENDFLKSEPNLERYLLLKRRFCNKFEVENF